MQPRLHRLIAASLLNSGSLEEPARGVEPLTYGLQNSGAPFRIVHSVHKGSLFSSLYFRPIALLLFFSAKPFLVYSKAKGIRRDKASDHVVQDQNSWRHVADDDVSELIRAPVIS
jgi:hypothetical protein